MLELRAFNRQLNLSNPSVSKIMSIVLILTLFILTGELSRVLEVTHAGGHLELESMGVRAVVPRNTFPGRRPQLIMISIITDVAECIEWNTDDMPVAFGVQCQPDGLRFQFPVTVTIPHCGVLSSVDKVTPVLYRGKGVIGKTKNYMLLCLRPVRVPAALCFRVVRPSVNLVKEELRNRLNLISEERVQFFKHNSENLMKIG